MSPAPSTTKPAPSDEAIALMRAAAVEEAGLESAVGEFLGMTAEDETARTLSFVAHLPGYSGWLWSVTGAQVGDGPWTVSEAVLLPGPESLIAPEWVPWDQRVRPGDLGAGELMPIAPDDERLVPGYVQSDDPAIEDVAREFGLGRQRVLSMDGRADAADRWHDGDFGPNNEVAQQAPGRCGTCGFFAPLAGLLGGAFGACANDMSPADGRVVDVEYGCGSHSEEAAAVVHHHSVPDVVIDELQMEIHQRPEPTVAPTIGDPRGDASVEGAADPRQIAQEAIRQLNPTLSGPAGVNELPATPVLAALLAAPMTPIALGGPVEPAAPIALGPTSASDPVGDTSAGDDSAGENPVGKNPAEDGQAWVVPADSVDAEAADAADAADAAGVADANADADDADAGAATVDGAADADAVADSGAVGDLGAAADQAAADDAGPGDSSD